MEEINRRNDIPKLIIKWWGKNKRSFPWRNTKEPYKIIIAELLLRKTTALQVEQIYPLFINKYKNALSLLKADKLELFEIIKPLGMEYKRIELLKKFANYVSKELGNKISDDESQLLKIPGVGPYTKNAVLCFAFNKDEPLLDTNFIRFIKRIYNLHSKKKRIRNDKFFWDFAKNIIPNGRGKDFNLAVLDFSSKVCKAKKPLCLECIINNYCSFHLSQ